MIHDHALHLNKVAEQINTSGKPQVVLKNVNPFYLFNWKK